MSYILEVQEDENGDLYITLPDEVIEELTNFGVSSHDDCVDALVYLLTGLMRKGQLQLDY